MASFSFLYIFMLLLVDSSAGRSDNEMSEMKSVDLITPNVPPSELDALYDLYSSTNGPNWRWVNNSFAGFPWTFTNASNPCAEDWQGVLCTSTLDDGYLHILRLQLNALDLHGQLPNSLDAFTHVQSISMSTNRLTGTIPATIGNFTHLQQVIFSFNSIGGTIPESMGNLTQLQVLYLNNNLLTGRMPEFFATFLGLVDFVINGNQLTGTVPASYGDLTLLQQFNVGNNRLAGEIPGTLGNLAALELFAVNSNYFSGSFPKEFAMLSNLMYIYIDDNGFYGLIPAFLGNLTKLEYIAMSSNYFTGQLPKELANLGQLLNMYFHTNQITGTIPPEFGQIASLQLMDLHGNGIAGPVPAALANLTMLTVLDLYFNDLTNTLPPELGLLSALQTMDFSQNYMTGTIPEEYGQLTSVQFFKLHECRLHGSIPHTIGDMTALSFLSLHDNHLTSTIPSSLQKLKYLNALFVFNNMFTGTIPGFINSTTQLNLAIVQVSGNALTGQIPDDLFAVPQLQTVILGSNCFHGTLPVAMCNATKVKTLSLDGLRSGSTCKDLMFPGTSKAYVLTSHITKGIPTCLFEMEGVNTLHLSGNGLTGPLPDQVSISGNLVDLSLSHNSLTGTIPNVFQERVWYNFDLSYNKLGGTLSSRIATVPGNITVLQRLGLKGINTSLDEYTITTAALSLRNNRLSHSIPTAVRNMLNVSVLDGNLFGCSLDQSDLPAHDSGRASYSCGSNSLDTFSFMFALMLCVPVVLTAATYYSGGKATAVVVDVLAIGDKWLRIGLTFDSDNAALVLFRYKYVAFLSNGILSTIAWCTLYVAVLLLPLYAIVSGIYGTHENEYAWTVSAAFLSGMTAFTLQLVFIFTLLLLLLLLLKLLAQNINRVVRSMDSNTYTRDSSSIGAGGDHHLTRKFCTYGIFFAVNVIAVAAANVGYLYAIIYGNSLHQILAQVGISVFKLAWSNFNTYLIRWTHHHVVSTSAGDWKARGAGFFAIQLFVQLFNYIAVPCIVVAAISPNCFNNAVVAAPTVTSSFYYERCALYSALFGCQVPGVSIASTSYSPPFTYSYQCSSSFVTYYSPAFVVMCIISGIFLPWVQVLLLWLHSRAVVGTRWFALLDVLLPRILKPTCGLAAEPQQRNNLVGPYFDANQHLITLLTYLALLLTFGAVFPPLAVCFLVSIACATWFARLCVGRFLFNAQEQRLAWCAAAVEEDCGHVGGTIFLRRAAAMVVSFSGLFYTLFLFDTLGDAVGFAGAYWVLVVVPVLAGSGAALCLYFPLETETSSSAGTAGETEQQLPKDVELSTVSPLTAALAAVDTTGAQQSDP